MEQAGLTGRGWRSAMGKVAREAGTSVFWLLVLGLWGMAWAGRGGGAGLEGDLGIAYEAGPRAARPRVARSRSTA